MNPSRCAFLSAGLALLSIFLLPAGGAVTRAASAARAAEDQGFRINNKSSEPVTVRVLHSNGELQKQETIKPGNTHRFTFNWCYDCCGENKHRRFEVKTGSTLRATGVLDMATKSVSDGDFGTSTCHEYNEMTVTDSDAGDAWTFSTGYTSEHRTAVLTVRNAAS